jgi:hypothetical protein
MALEDQVAQLSQNVGNLVNLVSTQANNWNAMVQNKINELEQWKQNAIKGYPAWNLISNARLDKVNSDGSPKGVYWYSANTNITATVIKETDSGWYTTQGNFVRISVSVADLTRQPYSNNSIGYAGLITSLVPLFPSNANFQQATVGFDYRVVSVSGNLNLKVGIEAGESYIDLNKTSWTSVSSKVVRQFTLAWFFLNEPTATLTIDLRNIYLNLGDANYYTLGIPQLTDLSI